jgi:hypothetical protein
MSEARHPTIGELRRALGRLADRVLESDDPQLETYITQRLRSTLNELQRFIPGLDDPPDREAARGLGRGAETALRRSQPRESLSRALRGLSFSPHEPLLCYLAASSCFELGAVEGAMRLLTHTLWLHPGHHAARADLEALTAYFDNREDEDRAA